MPTPLIEVENLYAGFAARPTAVDGISFTIERGECLALVGESGSGKSVTARTLVGLTGLHSRVRAESLRFDGEDLQGLAESRWRRIRGARIGFVLQDALSSLDPLRPVGREIAEPLKLHTTLTKVARQAKVLELLASVGVPEPELRAGQYPHQLSGGLRQRALIASAIACGPELLIADEPTTALDATIQAQILALLQELKAATSLLIVSHDLSVVARLADRVAVMRDGRIVEQGTTAQVLHDPRHDYTKALLAAVPATHAKGTRLSSAALVPQHRLLEEGEGILRKLEPVAGRDAGGGAADRLRPADDRRPNGGDPVISARELVKSFEGHDKVTRTVVSGVSFDLHPGETVGIVGESGSGKTTTARIVLGLEKPDSGTVSLHGRRWDSLRPVEQRAERRRLQVIYQDPLSSFDPRYTVERIIGEALGVIGLNGSARRDRTVELLELVSLDADYLKRRPLELSGGQRQRIAIARALAPEPEVIVCDEPVSALDVSVQAQILDLLADLQERLGVAYLFISHDLGVIHHVSDRVLVMKDGEVVEAGDVRQIFDAPAHDYTRALLGAVSTLALSK
ncbi:peptide/nickel transport system ATP-binding protein [Allocatelliglobosispora scoriae]|uniref:Peptide/nickel transport system ATP-binding protein n=1 Tax=Allocatelliglobosispora scoriae TaxID=643052 RepID=A0A841BGL7_9ACTN|nr:ABC transporter ATP-binding protein [Allocatelliglobosispora scoriae]MBB5868227.1 peptide/nickel transport system ATP-binding protein [Allocatelliglobosispora scoriae]